MKITSAMLRAKGACADQRRTFAELFPDGVEITEAICLSVANKFDWGWAAASLLPAPLYADYEAKRDPLYADYVAKRAPLDADYKAKCAAAFGRLAQSAE